MQPQIKTITLGDAKKGVAVLPIGFNGRIRLRLQDKFEVYHTGDGKVLLKNHRMEIPLENVDGRVIAYLYGAPVVFEPFLSIPFLKHMLRLPCECQRCGEARRKMDRLLRYVSISSEP